jgi:VanZ family protein
VRFKQFIPAITWFIISLVLLCLPGSTIPKYPWLAVIHADKWIHITLFGILCFLFSFPFSQSSLTIPEKKKGFVLITLSGIIYGTIMEFVQDQWIPNRSFEVLDIVADSAGCGLALIYSFRKFLRGGL